MNPDLQNRSDIQTLINDFYGQVREDEIIGYIFNDVMKVHWETHLPKIADFWETTLFGATSYQGNTLKAHVDINQHERLKPEHFERWLGLFQATVDKHFSGFNAERIKQKALSIATVMQIKLSE